MSTAEGTRDMETSPNLRAAAWLMRLRELEEMSPAELHEWQQFIASPVNRSAFELMQRVSRTVSSLSSLPMPSEEEVAQDDYDGSISIHEWKARQSLPIWRMGRRGLRSTRALVSLAASVFVVVLSAWIAFNLNAGSRKAFSTSVGEHRMVILEDGSRVTLGARTKIDVEFSGAQRVVHFPQGEALFTVARDRNRPFIVYAGGRAIVAVGTEFNIWRNLDRTTVTVTDGAIDVRPVPTSKLVNSTQAISAKPVRVSKGEHIIYGANGLQTMGLADPDAATAWRSGRLVYRHVPLKYVFSDVNRYFRQQIVIDDAAVGDLEFSGAVLQTQSPAEFLRALESIFPLEAVQVDSTRILIRSRVTPVSAQPATDKS